jgi:two-component system, chemotaxis family, protein-glutamate methylesterase/glutaminase
MIKNNTKSYKMVVIGASTGGPHSIKILLSGLPGNFPVGIVYVQHIEDSFYGHYAEWLNKQTELAVRLAENGDLPGPGELLLAPSGHHLIFHDGKLILDDSPPVYNLRPSIDCLFISAAEQFGASLIGVIMTGMGSDGAKGCVEIKSRRGYTIAQDETSSVIYGMARVAVESDGISKILPLEKIAGHLIELNSV